MAEKITKKPAAKKPSAKPATARKPRAVAAKHTPAAVETEKPVVAAEVEHKPGIKPMAKTGHGSSFYAVGKRKTSVAQILMTSGDGTFTLNKVPFETYFQTMDLRHIVLKPM